MTEFHEIGTPEWTVVADSSTGNFFLHNGTKSMWDSASIFSAALDGNLPLLQLSPNFSCTVPITGCSCMHYAVAGNQGCVVQFLLEKMKRPHAPDKSGVSPLSLACRYGHLDIVRMLISHGALLGSVDRRGNTCLHEAATLGQNHVLEYILGFVVLEYKYLLGDLVWVKNTFGQTCRDVAENDATATLVLSFMKQPNTY